MTSPKTNLITEKEIKRFLKNVPELKSSFQELKEKISINPIRDSPFAHLIKSIIYQQLAFKAASTIESRFLELIGELTPENILAVSFEDLRSKGLSRQKASYIQNVAKAFSKDGIFFEYFDIKNLDDKSTSEIVDMFTSIKGVGEWTVHMFLIFSMGRLDVLPYTDLSVRKGMQVLYDLNELPTPGAVKKLAKNWGDLATIGTLLCWKILDNE